MIRVGSIHTADDASWVLEKGKTDFAALGRAIVVNPHWVEKVENGEEDKIIDHLTESDQDRAMIPTPLWKLILEVEDWFPVKVEVHN